MRSSLLVLAISLLLLSFCLSGAQGIRFKKGLLFSFGHHKAHNMHEERSASLMKEGSDVEEVILCEEGPRSSTSSSSGMTRKLITTTTTSSSSTTTANKNEGNKANPTTKWKSSSNGDGDTQGEQGNFPTNSPPSSQHYVDITDITEMDYSPAKRKPPIHN